MNAKAETRKTVTVAIDGMSGARCVDQVTKALSRVPGADVQGVAVGSAEVAVPDTATANAALAAIQAAGYAARISPSTPSTPAKSVGGCGDTPASAKGKGRPGTGSCCG